MKKALIYSRLQFKRIARYIPGIFLITLVLCLCLGFALYSLINADSSDLTNQKLRVAIVGDMDDDYLSFGLSAIQSFDSSRMSIDILELTEEEARIELRQGNIVGYIKMPEDFIEDAVSGNVGKLIFVTNNTGIDMAIFFKEEVLSIVSCMLVESQNGVYGMYDITVDYNVEQYDVYDHINNLSLEYIGLIFSRSNILETEIIGISDNLTLGGYMFSGISVLLMLLYGIVCCPLFIRKDMALPKLMNANRYRPHLQICGEFSAFFSVMLINTVILIFAMLTACSKLDVIYEISDMTLVDTLIFAVKLLPAILAISSLQFLLYELTDSVVSGVLLQFICSIGLSYISGCLYPISFFPKAVRVFSSFTPSGLARGYISSLLLEEGSVLPLLALIGYSILLLGLTVSVRNRRIKTS